MKIKLKITAAELLYLEGKGYDIVNVDFHKIERENKSWCSVLFDVADKVTKQARALNRDFTNNKKPHSLSLKWHEAEALEKFLKGFDESDPYSANMSRKIIAQLNQKLL